MQTLLWLAGVLTALVGVVHSVLGELTLFNRLRWNTWLPSERHPLLRTRHVRILWATWHIASVFGFSAAALLFELASRPVDAHARLTLGVIAVAMAVNAMLVLVATRGRHPGWAGMLGVSTLIAAALAQLG